MKAKLSFCGGVGSVTGANFLLEGERTKLLIDCGLVQGEAFASEVNQRPFPYDPAEIGYLIVTHAHIDHIGRIPKLVRDGFRGKIVSTPPTRALAELMLADALSVLRQEGNESLYDEKDIAQALSLWETSSYHERVGIGEFELLFKDAGHVLGSAMCEVRTENGKRTLIFTGDLGNSPASLLPDTEPISDATYLVMESVYGDRNHEEVGERKEKLREVLRRHAEGKGVLLIPCFSLEKTQVLLHEMNDLLVAGEIPEIPVFLDSPLSIRVTEVYRTYSALFNAAVRSEIQGGDDIFKFPKLRLVRDARQSQEIERAPNPKIIIAGSGMSVGGRIVGHEKRYLADPANTILFVGYQAVGSLGRLIQEGVTNVNIEGEEVSVRARVVTITGYSSHKDSDHLLEFVSGSAETLEEVFVVMGEPKASLFLAQRINDYLGVKAVVPQEGERVELEL